jgi:hypothetical protein
MTSVGDKVTLTRSSDGKYLARQSNQTYSSPEFTSLGYPGFGGCNEIIYTVWNYTSVISGDLVVCVETRDPNTLEITYTVGELPRLEYSIAGTPSLSGVYITGTDRYLILLRSVSSVTDPHFEFFYYDTTKDFTFAGVKYIEHTNGGPNMVCWGLSKDVLTIADTGSPQIVTKYNILTETLIGTMTYGAVNSKGYTGPEDTLFATKGATNYIYTSRGFPSGAGVIESASVINSALTRGFFMDTQIGYENLLPVCLGKNQCTGYRWNTTTMVRSLILGYGDNI